MLDIGGRLCDRCQRRKKMDLIDNEVARGVVVVNGQYKIASRGGK